MNRSSIPALGVVAAAFAATLAVLPAHAARPDTRAMSCAAAQAFVQQRGAVVMTTGQYTYDRIVAGPGFCDFDEETQLKIAPTRDQPRCRVGFICRPATIFEDFFDRR